MDSSRVLYITGTRGVGKSTLLSAVQPRLHHLAIRSAVMPERLGSRSSTMSWLERTLWLVEQRIQRDLAIRESDKDVVLCDRSPVCALVFAYTNLNEDDQRRVIERYNQYVFLPGQYCHLQANPATVYQRLRQRGDFFYGNTEEQMVKTISEVEATYKLVFDQRGITPRYFWNEDHEAEEHFLQCLLELMMA